MKWLKRGNEANSAMREAEEAISESRRVSKRVERIVDEYKNTENMLVEFKKARRGTV